MIGKDIHFEDSFINKCLEEIKAQPSLLLEIDRFRIDYTKTRIEIQKIYMAGNCLFAYTRVGKLIK